jgi:acyl-coenzyme A synthetase/AMP-(fatty) acid ligase
MYVATIVMKFGDEPVKKYDRSSLRVLGSVGEPINPEAWRWYFDVIGDSKRPIVGNHEIHYYYAVLLLNYVS